MERRRSLDGLLDQSGAQASGTHADLLIGTVYDSADRLNVWIEDPSGLVVRMTDVVAGRRFLLTKIARECHGSAPSE